MKHTSTGAAGVAARIASGIAIGIVIGLGGAAARAGSGIEEATSYPAYRAPSSPYSLRASDLIGADVVNAVNETIGEVDDLIVVRGTGGVHAIIAVGGTLGFGEKLLAVPFQELQVSSDGETVFLDASAAALEARPAFRYNTGEPPGKQRWERRAELLERLQEERAEVRDALETVTEEERDVSEVARKLDKLER